MCGGGAMNFTRPKRSCMHTAFEEQTLTLLHSWFQSGVLVHSATSRLLLLETATSVQRNGGVVLRCVPCHHALDVLTPGILGSSFRCTTNTRKHEQYCCISSPSIRLLSSKFGLCASTHAPPHPLYYCCAYYAYASSCGSPLFFLLTFPCGLDAPFPPG